MTFALSWLKSERDSVPRKMSQLNTFLGRLGPKNMDNLCVFTSSDHSFNKFIQHKYSLTFNGKAVSD